MNQKSDFGAAWTITVWHSRKHKTTYFYNCFAVDRASAIDARRTPCNSRAPPGARLTLALTPQLRASVTLSTITPFMTAGIGTCNSAYCVQITNT